MLAGLFRCLIVEAARAPRHWFQLKRQAPLQLGRVNLLRVHSQGVAARLLVTGQEAISLRPQ